MSERAKRAVAELERRGWLMPDDGTIDDINAALDAAGSEWQPIETAPKETEVLVWFGPSVGVKSATCTEIHGPEIWSWCVTDEKFDPHPVRRYCEPYPTHWMPLPEAPKP